MSPRSRKHRSFGHELKIRLASLVCLMITVFAAVGVEPFGWPAGLSVQLALWIAAALALVAIFPAIAIFSARLARPMLVRLQRLISPFLLAVLYYGLVTPVAVVRRTFSRSGLRLRRNDVAGKPNSYWISTEAASSGDDLRRQY